MAAGAEARSGLEWSTMIMGGLVPLVCFGYVAVAIAMITDTTGAPDSPAERGAEWLLVLSSVVLAGGTIATAVAVATRLGAARALAAIGAVHSGLHHAAIVIAIVWGSFETFYHPLTHSTQDVLLVPVEGMAVVGTLVIAALPGAIGLVHVVVLALYARSAPARSSLSASG